MENNKKIIKSEKCAFRNTKSLFVKGSVYLCAGFTIEVLLFMLGYILVKGVPFLRSELFNWKYTSENCSVVPALINTLIMKIINTLVNLALHKKF